jgi:hypothetical protein
MKYSLYMELNNNQSADVVEAPVQPVQHPINNQRGNFPIILGVLVLLLAVGGGAYYLGTQKNQSSSRLTQQTNPSPTISTENMQQTSPTPTPDLTVNNDVKTYNAKYGYLLRYPKDWDVKEFPALNGQLEVTSFNPDKVTDRLSAVFVSVSSNPYDKESFGYGDPIKVGDFMGKKERGGGPPNANVHLRVVAPLGTKSIIFESSTEYEKAFDEMLSSFKLTN